MHEPDQIEPWFHFSMETRPHIRVLVLGDAHALGEALARRLTTLGAEAENVSHGSDSELTVLLEP